MEVSMIPDVTDLENAIKDQIAKNPQSVAVIRQDELKSDVQAGKREKLAEMLGQTGDLSQLTLENYVLWCRILRSMNSDELKSKTGQSIFVSLVNLGLLANGYSIENAVEDVNYLGQKAYETLVGGRG